MNDCFKEYLGPCFKIWSIFITLPFCGYDLAIIYWSIFDGLGLGLGRGEGSGWILLNLF